MHLGNAFSALLAWLSVRSQGGTMLLRMEDLDPQRCRAEYIAQLREDLSWLGFDWDLEQPPQSTRTAAYLEQFRKLDTYPCYCSRDALHAASAPHASDGTVIYPGTCRDLTPSERASRKKAPSWRLRVPDRTIEIVDGLQGVYSENLAKDCGDFILRRADGVFAYQLAVVTDDAAGGVTEVTRGLDLLSSSPRQRYLQELLGFAQVRYYHVPLLTDETGRRLSKRDGDLDLSALRLRMTAPEIIGRLAFAAGVLDHFEPATPESLVPIFDWKTVRQDSIVIGADWKV